MITRSILHCVIVLCDNLTEYCVIFLLSNIKLVAQTRLFSPNEVLKFIGILEESRTLIINRSIIDYVCFKTEFLLKVPFRPFLGVFCGTRLKQETTGSSGILPVKGLGGFCYL